MAKYFIQRTPAFREGSRQGAAHFTINGHNHSVEFDENGFGYTDSEEVIEWIKNRSEGNNSNHYSYGLTEDKKQ